MNTYIEIPIDIIQSMYKHIFMTMNTQPQPYIYYEYLYREINE